MGFAFNTTCTVRRYTDAKDATTGGNAPTFADTTGVRCAVQILTTAQRGGPSVAGTTQANIFFPYGTDVQQTDDVLTVPGYPNWVFSVQSDPVDDAGHGAYLRVEANHTTGMVVP